MRTRSAGGFTGSGSRGKNPGTSCTGRFQKESKRNSSKRQEFYDYANWVEETLDLRGDGTDLPYHEWLLVFIPEERRLDSLKDIARTIYHDGYNDAEIQEKIWSYCDRHGPLPEDFTTLIESGGADRNLSAC